MNTRNSNLLHVVSNRVNGMIRTYMKMGYFRKDLRSCNGDTSFKNVIVKLWKNPLFLSLIEVNCMEIMGFLISYYIYININILFFIRTK
jgi:hypothetical protein